MGYAECWALQRSLFDSMLAAKARRADGRDGAAEQDVSDQTVPQQAGTLLLVEHPLFRIDRGGDITFHGRGQIVGYPILDLERLGIGLRDYIDRLEEAVICVAADYGIEAGRIAGASGVWVEPQGRRARKLCAIGVRSSRFVTMHGFALNVNTDLRYFDYINPCGFTDRGVTSIERETGAAADMAAVKERLVKRLSEKLNVKIYK